MSGPLYRTFFGFHREPFGVDLKVEEILTTQALSDFTERFDYVLRLGAIGLLTGEVGAGKSTALRLASNRPHPSQYHTLWLTASGGSILETYRQLAAALDVETRSFSRAALTRIIRQGIYELVNKKIQPVLIIDEANLLRLDVFAELHTLCQFESDSKPHLPMILAGQNNLIDLLQYRSSLPLSSRIVARSHLEGIDLDQMQHYLVHHLTIAGVKTQLFSPQAITAIQQGSAGLLRRANHLARGALIAAANEKCQQVAAEHVRLASTELV
ncbi:MAG: AAA family ATPase [Deltaproteobacteria bacterium]|nr:AAA family ATPase [Deltaproteobacteria bacterium]